LAKPGRVDEHLTHTIPQATDIDVLADGAGRDQVLRIRHGEGQTLLRLL
jgi:hypothetical protein